MKTKIYIAVHGGTKQYTLRTRSIRGDVKVPNNFSLKEFREAERHVDPVFLMLKGSINTGRTRERSVWMREKGSVFFTCPWCGAIGSTDARYVDASLTTRLDSRYCSKCYRHLFLVFQNGDEEELVYLERKEGE